MTHKLPAHTAHIFRHIAYVLDNTPEHNFDMSTWIINRNFVTGTRIACELFSHNCGTTACVAGWAVALTYPKADLRGLSIHHAGSNILGLTYFESEMIFIVADDTVWSQAKDQGIIDVPLEDDAITPQIAATVLRAVADGFLTVKP